MNELIQNYPNDHLLSTMIYSLAIIVALTSSRVVDGIVTFVFPEIWVVSRTAITVITSIVASYIFLYGW